MRVRTGPRLSRWYSQHGRACFGPFPARGDVVEEVATGSADDFKGYTVVRGLALCEFSGPGPLDTSEVTVDNH